MVEEASLPEFQPDFLSDWAWRRVRDHFTGTLPYDPEWMAAYSQPKGYMAEFEEYYDKLEEERNAKASREGHYRSASFSNLLGHPPTVAAWRRYLNNWICAHQVRGSSVSAED